ncbi:MAG: hypothetical protein AABX97_06610 [Candidatus Thermoplasmatota archaeon]|mgnify:CR=1 FL=1
MPRDRAARFLRALQPLPLAAFLGLALGYVVFNSVFPNVSFPASGETSGILAIGILVLASFLAGLVTVDVRLVVFQSFLAIPIGIAVASALAISPVLTGYVEVGSDELVGFVLRLGIPIYLLALPVFPVLGLARLFLREHLGLRASSFWKRRVEPQRK